MSRKFSSLLALVTVLTFCAGAFGQDTSATTSIDWLAQNAGTLGVFAALLWWALFTLWGGFRWISN